MSSNRRTMTMNWDDLKTHDADEDDDDERFFESRDRISVSSNADRASFASAISNDFQHADEFSASSDTTNQYDLWKTDPESIKERRLRLLQGMGLYNDKDFPTNKIPDSPKKNLDSPKKNLDSPKKSFSPIMIVRSRSEGALAGRTQFLKENLKLTKTSSMPGPNSIKTPRKQNKSSACLLIKNLDTGKEFAINGYDRHGRWSELSDLETGRQLTMEEFEECVGYSPVVKELMRRENISKAPDEKKTAAAAVPNSYLGRSFRYSKQRGVALLKNIKGVANSLMPEGLATEGLGHINDSSSSSLSSRWTKVRQCGKSHKELSALHLCQEIPGHEGSIWAIRFSLDGRYLASAGEDRVIHVWEVQECEIMPTSDSCASPDRPPASMENDRKRAPRKGNQMAPDYVYTPDTVFSLSEKPGWSLEGHQDDVLDLSWSRSQLLLSSSMDKTVRLWDMESKCCLKLFAHNDYVTCIQFNPMDDNYFISGSLDAKVRLWSVNNRQVVDWSDLHEMVTAASYTPDGQGALVGSHKGNCRFYETTDCKLSPTTQFGIHNKNKAQSKKITGFQFVPGSNSRVLITSADSRIRIYDGSDMVYKFRGFRNTSSQISASFNPDGKYIICASEDSNVYVWRRPEEPKNKPSTSNKNKGFVDITSHENFQCRGVSAAIPWPGTLKGDPPQPPPMAVQSKRHRNKKVHLPPLLKKNTTTVEKPYNYKEEDHSGATLDDSCESFNSAPRQGEPWLARSESGYATSSSWSDSSSPPFDGENSQNGHQAGATTATTPTAWGMVIVTASLSGELRAFQNFGLPLRIRRQNNILFNGIGT